MGENKGDTCANGRIHRRYIKYGETVSLSKVSIEDLFTTLVVDAYEGQDIGIFDVPGEFLHTEVTREKQVLIKL